MKCWWAGLLLGQAVRPLAAGSGQGQRGIALAESDSVSALQRQVVELGEQRHAVDVGGGDDLPLLPTSLAPRIFVAIFTATGDDYTARRAAVRRAWHRSGAHYMTVRFMVCGRPRDLGEQWREDMVPLDCEESYGRGLLTKKAAQSMRYYTAMYPDVPYYFKTDDDTFVRPDLLLSRVDRHREAVYLYGGVLQNRSQPDRDPASKWYESVAVYSRNSFPPTALGGPGYVLSRRLVEEIVNSGLPQEYPLFNEDRAIAVWVKMVDESLDDGTLHYINIEGENGLHNHCRTIRFSMKWKDFPWVLFHKLSATEIECISRYRDDDDNVKGCFCSG